MWLFAKCIAFVSWSILSFSSSRSLSYDPVCMALCGVMLLRIVFSYFQWITLAISRTTTTSSIHTRTHSGRNEWVFCPHCFHWCHVVSYRIVSSLSFIFYLSLSLSLPRCRPFSFVSVRFYTNNSTSRAIIFRWNNSCGWLEILSHSVKTFPYKIYSFYFGIIWMSAKVFAFFPFDIVVRWNGCANFVNMQLFFFSIAFVFALVRIPITHPLQRRSFWRCVCVCVCAYGFSIERQ